MMYLETELLWSILIVISVCFDGASTVPGSIGGVQAKCKLENKNILYGHGHARCFNLALVEYNIICEKVNSLSTLKINICIFNFLILYNLFIFYRKKPYKTIIYIICYLIKYNYIIRPWICKIKIIIYY